jgi:acyl-CoA synthetase (AMP-forming)/AMP-acid ligase II
MTRLGDLIRSAAAKTPDRVLLHTRGGGQHTVGKLVKLGESLPSLVAEFGVVPGDVVLLEFSPENWPLFVAAYLGCLINDYTPALVVADGGEERRNAVLRSVEVRCQLRSGVSRKRDWRDCGVIAGNVFGPPRPRPEVADYLLTSGTSGVPKVVAVGLEARLAPRLNCLPSPGVVALTTPPGTNAAQTALAEALLSPTGGLACLDRWSPNGFVELVESSEASCALLAPALASMVIRSPRFEPARLSGLRLLRLGMAPAAPDLIQAIAATLPWVRITNIYTSTEAWPAGTTMRYNTGAAHSVGKPLPGTLIRIVDAAGAAVPAGIQGRIQLAYIPVNGTADASAWVETGDIGMLEGNGDLVFVGRATDMVTSGGMVVSFVAVEQAIMATGLVLDAVAFAVNAPEGQRLGAAVVWASDGAREDQLRQRIRERLGADATPRVLRSVDEIPRDMQGKLCRSKFRASAASVTGASTGSVAERLHEIWSEVLMRSDIGWDDDFFELGGDSLAIVMCNSLLEDRLNVVLAISCHYEAPTLGDFTKLVEAELGGQPAVLCCVDALPYQPDSLAKRH